MTGFKRPIFAGIILLFSTVILAVPGDSTAKERADADVIAVEAVENASGDWTFHVTVAHPDTGWDDYCNGWDIVTDQGQVLKQNASDPFTRLLHHPHEAEQPFTRSQSGLHVPENVNILTVRAHDIVQGFGGQEIVMNLASGSGPGYRVTRN